MPKGMQKLYTSFHFDKRFYKQVATSCHLTLYLACVILRVIKMAAHIKSDEC